MTNSASTAEDARSPISLAGIRDKPGIVECDSLGGRSRSLQVVATFRNEAAYERHMHIDFHDRLVPPILGCVSEDIKLEFYRSLP
ncbi:hypothetical protein [Novosphingobium guangzhouense]|uniref:hypothetical protein n=1 Tax=Novosphingobium guangzhouense TaxID=1850347 RepID=UPI001B8059B1|nr:hypothetical protein [Novosphingobium guangzhouense]